MNVRPSARTSIDADGALTPERDFAPLGDLIDIFGAAVICNADGVVQVYSSQATELLGSLDGLHVSAIDALLSRLVTRRRHRRGPFAGALAGKASSLLATLEIVDGGHVEVLVSAKPLQASEGEQVTGALMTLQRRDLRPTRTDSSYLGLHDPLTGLPNRRLLRDRLLQAIARAGRTGESFVVGIIDLEHFKQVNDEHGHATGDELLRQVGARLVGVARPSDTVARIGGDEFAAVLEDVGSGSALDSIAQRLLAAAKPISVRGIELAVDASVGVTLAGAQQQPDKLLHQAGLAMNQAKRQGSNRWVLFDDRMAHEAHRVAHLISELRRAIAAGTISVAYQPEIDLQRGVTVGYEALVRWNHPQFGEVEASELIELAERSNMMSKLGSLVLDRACEQATRWSGSSQSAPPWIAVNVSARELVDSDFAARVFDTLKRWNLPGSRLFLELTESVLVQASTVAEEQLGRLDAAGVRLAIDDFGTGYASLTYLQRLPVHQVKIDRSFIRGLPESREDDVIATSVIGLAHNLDLTVVAEGIETGAQLAFLRSVGCDLGQGYLLGRPGAG